MVKGSPEGQQTTWLPDWLDPKQYPDPKTAPLLQWAWEFLRRNAEYQADAILAARWPATPGNTRLENSALFEKLQSIDTEPGVSDKERREWKRWGELQSQQISKVSKLARKWHLLRGTLPDPANANAWNEDDFELPGHFQSSYPARDLRTGKPCPFLGTPKHPDEVSVIFDLTDPLPAQLKAASRRLVWLKHEYTVRGWIKNRRLRPARPTNLRLYLRVTDAKTVGVKDSEIAKILYGHLPNQHPEFHGTRRVIDAASAARRLIEGGYANLRTNAR